jgi:hypothetical protein
MKTSSQSEVFIIFWVPAFMGLAVAATKDFEDDKKEKMIQIR